MALTGPENRLKPSEIRELSERLSEDAFAVDALRKATHSAKEARRKKHDFLEAHRGQATFLQGQAVVIRHVGGGVYEDYDHPRPMPPGLYRIGSLDAFKDPHSSVSPPKSIVWLHPEPMYTDQLITAEAYGALTDDTLQMSTLAQAKTAARTPDPK